MRNKLTKNLNTVTLILLAVVLFISCPLIAYAAALQSHFSLGGSITYEYRQRINYEFLDVEDFFFVEASSLQATNAENWNKYRNKVESTEFVIDARGIVAEIGDNICYDIYEDIYFNGTVILGGYVNSITPNAFSIRNEYNSYVSFYIDTLILDIANPYDLYDFNVIDFSGITVRQLFIGGNGYTDWGAAPILRSLPNTIETFVCEAPISEIENQACFECRKLSVFDADLSRCSYIGQQAFYNCWSMPMPTDIKPSTSIGQDAFANVSFPRQKIRNIQTGKIHEGYIVDGSTIDALINGYYNDWQQAISFVPDFIKPMTSSAEYMDLIAIINSAFGEGIYTETVIYFTYDALNALSHELERDGNLDNVLNALNLFYLSYPSFVQSGTHLQIVVNEYSDQLGNCRNPYANILVAELADSYFGGLSAYEMISNLLNLTYSGYGDAAYIENLDEHIDTAFDLTRNEYGEATGTIYTPETYPVLFNAPTFEYVELYPSILNYVDFL